MPRPKNPIPSYRLHKQSGQAIVRLNRGDGTFKDMLLGKYDSPESKQNYARLIAELKSGAAPAVPTDGVTVAELLLAYLKFAEKYYADAEGKPTAELGCMKASIKPVRELYADVLAVEFGPLALRAVRQRMIEAGLCRTLVNRRTDRVKRVFKWAVAEELIPVTVYDALRTLAGLRRGRTEAHEAEPVKPVADELVKATLPHLPPHVRGIIELMYHTGMRPSEACRMTLAQVDRTGETWFYRPAMHKTQHHGKDRVIPLGPKARAVIIDFLRGRSLDQNEPLFSPKRQREERFAEMREGRKSPVQPSQVCRKRKEPKKVPGEWYIPTAICRAVRLACERGKLEHWFPYQLRHAFGTRARKEAGVEAAQTLLGHARLDMTEHYALKNHELAASTAAKIG